MIRDPSDGTVYDQPKPETGIPASKIDPMVSGLPEVRHKAAYLERLNASREWLKNYFQPKDQQ